MAAFSIQKIFTSRSLIALLICFSSSKAATITGHLGDRYFRFMVSNRIAPETLDILYISWYRPYILQVRLDAQLAILLPCIILWYSLKSKKLYNFISKFIICLTAGYVPVIIQIIVWPFILNSNSLVDLSCGLSVAAVIGVASFASLSCLRAQPGSALLSR